MALSKSAAGLQHASGGKGFKPLVTSEAGQKFLSVWEGVVLTAYADPGTGGKPWTIGIGHTSSAGAPVVVKGMTITRAQAFEILARDLQVFEAIVRERVKVLISQQQFDALVSLCFNIGGTAFAGSSVVRHLNAGRYLDAAAAFEMWNKAGGRVMSGLVRRREAERALFETDIYVAGGAANDDVDVGTVLRRGSKHPDAIRALQLDLIALGWLPADRDADDGDFGPATEKAVIGFQTKAGLTADGRVGPATRSAIALALKAQGARVAVGMYPLPGQKIAETLAA